jgi:hypothetical protein
MGLKKSTTRQTLYTEARLAWLLETIDELHTAISDGNTASVTTMSEVELKGFLHEVMYMAQEALDEIECQRVARAPRLKLIRKSS